MIRFSLEVKNQKRSRKKERAYGQSIRPSFFYVRLFSDRVAALYSLAYAVKMGYKSTATKNILLNEIHDFTVYPLEEF